MLGAGVNEAGAAVAGKDEAGLIVLVLLIAAIVLSVLIVRWRRRVMRAGKRGLMAYLRDVPRTDVEKRDALDLVLRGAVIFLIGLVAKPLLIIGAILFYYGFRKLCMMWMGLVIPEATSEPPGEPPSADAIA